MRAIFTYLAAALMLFVSCTTQQHLAYLDNLPETGGEEFFLMEIPEYRLQARDNLYISARAISSQGVITDLMSVSGGAGGTTLMQGEAGQFIHGYEVDRDGNVLLPVVGKVRVAGLTISEARLLLQEHIDELFSNATVECKLLSFKYTVIGEVKTPGSYINYNSYLTVFEAIGRAGGVGDLGRRDRVLVVRPSEQGTTTYRLNLQDKAILSSEAYFLLPNDVVIVEPHSKKVFNINLPTYSFVITTVTTAITTTLLLINYFR